MDLSDLGTDARRITQEILGYLNFSSGAPDPGFLKNVNALFGLIESARSGDEPAWQTLAAVLCALWLGPLGGLGSMAACSAGATQSPAVAGSAEPDCVLQEQPDAMAASGDCRNTTMCGDLGRCTWVADKCKAMRDRDCASSRACLCFGACAANQGECVAGSDAGCRRSHICRQSGRCTASGGDCVATSDADCEASAGCNQWGACVNRRGGCWPR